MDLLVDAVFVVGSLICHQLPERSFFSEGRQFPVCARCAGLYVSGAVGLLSWLGYKASRGWRPSPWRHDPTVRALSTAAVPTIISLATGALGIWDGSNVTRALLAVPLGACAGAIVAAVATKDLR